MTLCGCFDVCQTKYKRTVDNIFPAHAKDGIIRSNLTKLTYYAESHPEKLDRIGEYLASKVARDLPRRHRTGFILISIEAMDALLYTACRVQSLNLLIEAYLKVVQLLLESPQPEMQLLATKSFIKFANIDEDTPSYHRRYDFFVSKFSSLCHSTHENCDTRKALRLAGLNGLKGVIRKTVSDDLQVDIWEKDHMGKIIPSLLYNMEDNTLNTSYDQVDGINDQVRPSAVAEDNLRHLIGKATFDNIRAVFRPVLDHLDYHGHWDTEGDEPNDFAMHIFRVALDAIQNQHVYAVIQILMTHLDTKELKIRPKFQDHEAMTKVRTGIAQVLSNIVAIAAAESIGPTVLEIINSLLNHLRCSINYSVKLNAVNAERRFQDTIINALGEFANNLPDFQKIEIMMFIISKVPPTSASSEADVQLQAILLKSLLKVATKYRTVNMSQAFPSPFLKPLLIFSLAPDSNVRLMVQKIFHQLLDRHGNLVKLCKPQTLNSLPPLGIEKAYRQDIMFMKKNGGDILQRIFESFKHTNNTGDNYDALYTTLALLCVELSSDDVLVEILRVALNLQDLASTTQSSLVISEQQQAAMHAICAALHNLCAHLSPIPALVDHVQAIIRERQENAFWMLAESNHYAKPNARRESIVPNSESNGDLNFDKKIIEEAFRSTGHETSTLFTPFQPVSDMKDSPSSTDLNQITVDIDSAGSSPGANRRFAEQGVTFAAMRKVLTSTNPDPEATEKQRAQLLEMFRTQTLNELQQSDRRYQAIDLRSTVKQAFTTCLNDKSPTKIMAKKPNSIKLVALPESNKKSDEVDQVDMISENQDENPFESICLMDYDDKRPPLFAMRFPNLFALS